MKFRLHDIRESKVWKAAYEEGGDEKARRFIEALLASGMTPQEVAERLHISLREVEQLASEHPNG